MVYSLQELFMLWQSYGIFDILLPFLLIFAIVFGILTYLGIFGKNKGIHIIIALVIGILAVQMPFFNEFYKEVFPRLGVGVAILLVVMILIGLFVEAEYRRYWGWGLSAIALVIAIVILVQTFGYLGWTGIYGYFGSDVIGWLVGAIILIGIIIAIAATSGGGAKSTGDKVKSAVNAFFKPWNE